MVWVGDEYGKVTFEQTKLGMDILVEFSANFERYADLSKEDVCIMIVIMILVDIIIIIILVHYDYHYHYDDHYHDHYHDHHH